MYRAFSIYSEFFFQLRLQLKSGKGWKTEVPTNLSISRRDMMIYLTAGILSGPTEPVEARVVKPEIRRKIREKAGLSKLKNENGRRHPQHHHQQRRKSFHSCRHCQYHLQILKNLWWKQLFPDHKTVMTLHPMILC